jgi:NADPH2 dehydrogenase
MESSTSRRSRVWNDLKIGRSTINHRIAMCPLTRYRSPNSTPGPFVSEYYEQRSNGNLIISEGTFISGEAGGHLAAPGIYNQEQIDAWRIVTDAVHKKGAVIYCQLWALGRGNKGLDPRAPIVYGAGTTPIPGEGNKIPTPMTKEVYAKLFITQDIARFISHYVHAAKCAIKAGFDGVELHGAHGYLLDQFIQASSNNTRTDEYGGSLENRCRLILEVLKSVGDAIGEVHKR